MPSFVSAAARRLATSGGIGALAAVAFERGEPLLQRRDLLRAVGRLEAELLGEDVGGEQRDDAAGEAGSNVGEEAAVAARCRTRGAADAGGGVPAGFDVFRRRRGWLDGGRS